MKFKKDGKVFDDIMKARRYHCNITEDCDKCFPKGASCSEECRNNPRKSARLMGFEVIEDGYDKMGLPIDIGSMTMAQAKEYCREFRHKNGYPCEEKGCELKKRHICMDWVHEWDFERLTPQELEICRDIGAKWISMDYGKEPLLIDKVYFWRDKPELDGDRYSPNRPCLAFVSSSLMPSVRPGDCINVEELLNGMDTT